jgi:hypothetical protein
MSNSIIREIDMVGTIPVPISEGREYYNYINPRHVGWVYHNIINDLFVVRLNTGPDSTVFIDPVIIRRFSTCEEAIQEVDEYFGRRVELDCLLNAELGYRILAPRSKNPTEMAKKVVTTRKENANLEHIECISCYICVKCNKPFRSFADVIKGLGSRRSYICPAPHDNPRGRCSTCIYF